MIFSSLRAALIVGMLVGAASGCRSAPRGHSAVEHPQPKGDEDPIVTDPIVRLLQNRSPGLMITRNASGELAVQLQQGPTSFYGSSDPLYLIDDVPYRPGPGGALTGVNPYDIESITALRKPEDTGIYGVRGANGVILIKMKKPGKSD
jgi:TonB-dependent SusC/RagA subfamily outer membrane receptor